MDFEKKGRIWAEVNFDNMLFNFQQAEKFCPGVKKMAVLKADAYGHCITPCAKFMVQEGKADYLAVATPEEGLKLRRDGITAPILLLGIAPQCEVAELSANDITCACNTVETAEMFSQNAVKPMKIHAMLDTGMTRLGMQTLKGIEYAGDGVIEMSKKPNLILEGIFTHFAVSDMDTQDEYTNMQLKLFEDTVSYIKGKGVNISIVHCANSGAIVRFSDRAKKDMFRCGTMLYGIYPDPCMRPLLELRPTLSIRTRVTQVKTVDAGVSLSYGRTWTAEKPTEIATIGIGYADGLLRANSGKIYMAVNGKKVRQIGRICMDICMIDVTGLGVKIGDVVTVIGQDGDVYMSAEALGENVPTIPHEIISGWHKRIPRIYYRHGKAVGRQDWI